MDIENFIDAFDEGVGSSVAICECGKIFYNPDVRGWDWEDGELERLEKDPESVALDYAVPRIRFEGKEYVPECDCWKERAGQIMGFIDTHALPVAVYLTLEKKRKTKEADLSPVVG